MFSAIKKDKLKEKLQYLLIYFILCVCISFLFFCSPIMVFDRHNEVWYVVQDDPVCGSSEEMGL